jgi:hypothetical protein
MIDKNSLRCGNLVRCGDKIVTVEEIGDEGINLVWMHEITHWDYDYNQLMPIELNEYWLRRMEFKEDFHNKLGKTWLYSIMASAMRFFGICNITPRTLVSYLTEPEHMVMMNTIRYVHEVQNHIYLLTGKELSIKEPGNEAKTENNIVGLICMKCGRHIDYCKC